MGVCCANPPGQTVTGGWSGPTLATDHGPGAETFSMHFKTLTIALLIHKYTILFAIFRGNLGIKL